MTVSQAEWQLNVLALSGLVVSTIGTELALIIQKIYCSPTKNVQIHAGIKLFAILEMVCYLLSFTFAALTAWLFQSPSLYRQIFYGLFMLFLVMGLLSSYLFFVCRYYYTFLDSAFAMKRRFFYFHGAVALSIPSYSGCALYLYYIEAFGPLVVTCIVGIGVTFVAYLVLVAGFNRNLFQLVLKHRHQTLSNLQRQGRPSFVARASLNKHQLLMIEHVAKQTLLGSVHVACIMLLIVVCIANFITKRFLQHEPVSMDHSVFMVVLAWATTLTIVVGRLCVFLGFAFNDKAYSFVCGGCHARCQYCCEAMAEWRIEKEEALELKTRVKRVRTQSTQSTQRNRDSVAAMSPPSPAITETESPDTISLEMQVV